MIMTNKELQHQSVTRIASEYAPGMKVAKVV
jgi:hypothetical protein